MTKTRKYIIYRADWKEDRGWRTFTENRTLTGILNETFDSSVSPIPEVGERLTDDKTDEEGTHYSRWGDWVVSRVESYLPDMPVGQEFTEVVICWCKYDPIEPEWVPQGKSIVSVESFGGDAQAFEKWKSENADNPRYEIVEMPEKVR
ncbi:MAG: hypothetical protein WBF52_11875 [Geitlerinemataceae cyanobacterium]